MAPPKNEEGLTAAGEEEAGTSTMNGNDAAAPESSEAHTSTMSPAVTQVMNTTELLENVLLYLNHKTLLYSKRVSRRFRETMDGSIRIQRALFFEPLSTPTLNDIKLMEGHERLLAGISHALPANPLLDRFLFYSSKTDYDNIRRGTTSVKSCSVAFQSSTAFQTLASSPTSASWRRMFVIQPQVAPVSVSGMLAGQCLLAQSGKDGMRMNELLAIEVKERHILRGGSGPWGSVRLHRDLDWSLGGYRMSSVGRKCRDSVVNGICGWDVLSPTFGVQLQLHHGAIVDEYMSVLKEFREAQERYSGRQNGKDCVIQ